MRGTATSWVVAVCEAREVVLVVLMSAASSYDHDKSRSNSLEGRRQCHVSDLVVAWDTSGKFHELACACRARSVQCF
jgi:hypothetical protein